VFQITAAGLTSCTGAAALSLAQVFQITAAGLTVTYGSAAVSGGTPAGGSGDGAQTGSQRRWAEAGGMRRRLRR
jgi:hypothetical protein